MACAVRSCTSSYRNIKDKPGIKSFHRLTVQRLLTITVLASIAADVLSTRGQREHQTSPACGGRLRGPRGVIQTPNFPDAFPVPIRCRWVLEQDAVNGTISIYFTQQYTTSGLTFTEYMYYDDSYKLGERRALTVTEENITRVKWLQVTSPVLVVELSLDRLEGTQLRALGLLSVFGLNVTYELGPAPQAGLPRPPPPPTGSCSAIECRLLGHCYAAHDYRSFFCACFEGYSGADCGVGPLCPRTHMCKNGGTCRQMGPAAVSCICAPGYTGDLCEAQIEDPGCGIDECGGFDCSPRDNDALTARFEIRLQIADHPNTNISHEIVKQLTSYLKASNVTLEDEMEVVNISSPEAGARSVWVRVWGRKAEAGALRTALSKLAAAARPSTRLQGSAPALNFLNAPLHFNMYPALHLHSLQVNQRPEVWEGSEFILSCMAYGSPDIVFSWYKDGVRVNFNGTTRDIWSRTVAEDALGRRMSVLGVSEARGPDGGRWACAARDAGRTRCRTLRLAVLRPPDIRLVPSALTVHKGDNVSITCLAGAGRVHGALGFSWARERALLPLRPQSHVWEDLYPAGSVLHLYNVQKSSEFRCQVSSVAGTNSKGVTMWALGPHDEACQAEASHGLRWPKTAPGAHAAANCPPGYSGETTRFCEPKTGQHGVKWMLPDFSGCISDSLQDIYEQFSLISYGYSWEPVRAVARQYGAVLRSLPPLPGAGAPALRHCAHMLRYLRSSAATPAIAHASAIHLLNILDTLLEHPDAFLDEEKIFELQTAVVEAAGLKDHLDMRLHEFTVKTRPVNEDGIVHLSVTPNAMGPEEWILRSVEVELLAQNGNATVVAVEYHNLAARLPSLRTSVEFKSGQEVQFAVSSRQTQVWAGGSGMTEPALRHTVTLRYTHLRNYTAVGSKLACGVRSPSEPHTWSTAACEVRVPEGSHVLCRCRGLGTIALLTVDTSTMTDVEKELRGVVLVCAGVGGCMGLCAAALQLAAGAWGGRGAQRLPAALKAATAATHAAALLSLLQCDTRQDEACPGPWGWAVAWCWCFGCAALCAQPLILQAELAGSGQRVVSAGLLAGVCTLALLSARLWGGAPLQLGAAAMAVCAAGCALLHALALALSACAALRLRTLTCKVPVERRNYLRERGNVIRHTLVLVFSTSAVQAAGVAYAQPGERTLAHVAALSVAALICGLAMLICYVLRDERCLQSARRVLSLPNKDCHWHPPPEGDTSLSLYIAGCGEAEVRGAAESSSSHVSPAASYWRAPAIQSPTLSIPTTVHRRLSTPDTRADIVQCVEYKESGLRYGCTRAVCDLIPHAHTRTPPHYTRTGRDYTHTERDYTHTERDFEERNYSTRVCLQLGATTRNYPFSPPPLLACSVQFQPYDKRFHTIDTSKQTCSLCVQSNPDVSKIPSPPIKSCLKKTPKDFTSSVSLPSMEVIRDEPKSKSDIEQVNREWKRAYDSPADTDKVIHKISSDLNFLLNRTEPPNSDLDEIEEAPT